MVIEGCTISAKVTCQTSTSIIVFNAVINIWPMYKWFILFKCRKFVYAFDIIDLLTSESNELFLRKFHLEQWDVRQHRKWILEGIVVLVSLCYRGKFLWHRKIIHVSYPFDEGPLRRMLFDDLANRGRKNSKDTALMVAEHIEIENYKPNSTFANSLDL